MPKHARLVLPSTIAALAASLSIFAFSPLNNAANAAGTCLTAPKGAAPAGSHWYYRLERGTQRKCWRLVQKDQQQQKNQTAAASPMTQGDTDDDTDDTAPAPSANVTPPVANKAAASGAPDLKSMQSFVTRDASETVAPSAPLSAPPPVSTAPDANTSNAPAPLTQAQNQAQDQVQDTAPAPATAVEQPAPQPVSPPVTATQNAAASAQSGGTSMAQLILAAILAAAFLALGIVYFVGMKRRRTDVLNRAQHLNKMPFEVPAPHDLAPAATRDAPTFAPLPPMEPIGHRDDHDLDEALRRFSQAWKRRAA